MTILENIAIDKAVLENINIDIDKDIFENIDIDIDKDILENIDIDKDILGKNSIFSADFEYFHPFLRTFLKISISIREFCKILILMKYCINKELAYLTSLLYKLSNWRYLKVEDLIECTLMKYKHLGT